MKKRYRWTLKCPRCGRDSETVTDATTAPHVNCGDCLMDEVEIVEFDVVSVKEEAF
jgi:transcription elongation factor Elf1